MDMQEPLLKVASSPESPAAVHVQPVKSEKVPLREWRQPWWAVLGKCSAGDAVALLLTLKLPLVAHAWNEARVGSKPFFRTLLLWALGLLAMFMLANLQVAGFMATCPATWRTDGPTFVLAANAPVYLHTSDTGLRVLSNVAQPSRKTLDEWEAEAAAADRPLDDGPMHGPFGGPGRHGPPHPFMELPPELRCYGMAISTAATIAMFALVCLALLHLARRRSAMRAQFGIEGSHVGDVALYAFCAPCALAQETRTLMHNHVVDGLWHGPLPYMQCYATVAPVPVAQMV